MINKRQKKEAKGENKTKIQDWLDTNIDGLATLHSGRDIGSGSESIVFERPNDTTKVEAINFYHIESPIEAKRIFYRHRLFNTLFPHNFPKIYASQGWNSVKNNITGTVREKIEEGSVFDHDYSFGKVQQFVKQLDLPIAFDTLGANIRVGVDGGQYYLDKIEGYKPIFKQWDPPTKDWDKQAVEAYLKANKYTPDQIEIAMKSIDRIEKLDKDEITEKDAQITKSEVLDSQAS